MMKKNMIVIICFCIMLVLIGCNKKENKSNPPATDSNVSSTAEPEEIIDDEEDDDTDELLEGEQGGNLEIYTIDSDTLEIAPLSVTTEEENITAKVIVDAVINNMDEEIGVAKVEEKKTNVIVYFQTRKAPLSGCSSQIEKLILDCIANSVLDNLPTCENVIFRSENGNYESGHISLEKDEIYANK